MLIGSVEPPDFIALLSISGRRKTRTGVSESTLDRSSMTFDLQDAMLPLITMQTVLSSVMMMMLMPFQ